jgi:RNA polymerase sigma-70 factor (ECF subfamily)
MRGVVDKTMPPELAEERTVTANKYQAVQITEPGKFEFAERESVAPYENQEMMSPDVFMSLLNPTLRHLRTFVRSRLGTLGDSDGDDIVQQILLRAFAYRNQFRFRSAFKTWLWAIAINEIRQFFRRRKDAVSLNSTQEIEFADRALSPLAKYEQIERTKWVQAGLAKLSERDSTVVRMRDLNGHSVAEIAQVLAMTRAAVKTNIFRARQRLAQTLREPGTLQPVRNSRGDTTTE